MSNRHGHPILLSGFIGFIIHQLLQSEFALDCIVPVFTYLSRFYIEAKFQTELRKILNGKFAVAVVNPVYKRILGKLPG